MSDSEINVESLLKAIGQGKIDKIPGKIAFIEFALKKQTITNKYTMAECAEFAVKNPKKILPAKKSAQRIHSKKK